jgi:glutamate synthase domain-containing protein 2
VPEAKSVKVANYAKSLIHEVEIIAHSVGVKEPREISRRHVRIVKSSGVSIPLNVLMPRPEIRGSSK